MFNAEKGLAVPRSCKRWQCPECRRFKRLAVLVALQHGLATFGERGHQVHALTITDGPGDLDFKTFYAAWDNRVRPWLRRHGYLHAYASALEVQPESKRLHCHCLAIAPAGSSGFVPHRDFSEACGRAGLGFAWIDHITDIPEVSSSLAGYFVKTADHGDFSVPTDAVGEIGSYMAKAKEIERLAGFSASRLRPFRVSRNWPINLTEAVRRLRVELYGESTSEGWEVVHESHVSRWLDPLLEQKAVAQARAERWTEVLRVEVLRQYTS